MLLKRIGCSIIHVIIEAKNMPVSVLSGVFYELQYNPMVQEANWVILIK